MLNQSLTSCFVTGSVKPVYVELYPVKIKNQTTIFSPLYRNYISIIAFRLIIKIIATVMSLYNVQYKYDIVGFFKNLLNSPILIQAL